MKRGLFIGRFQPFHLGHLQDIKDALKEVDELIIGVGSSKEKNTEENPFSAEERTRMIDLVLPKNSVRNYIIFPIPDFHDDKKWVENIESLMPNFDVVYTGNDWTERCFKTRGYTIKKVKILEGVTSTIIRDRMANNHDWQSLVPKEVAGFISKIKGVERVKEVVSVIKD